MNNDKDFDRFDYDEMSKLFEEAKKERKEEAEIEEYQEIRRTSKRDQANAFLESLKVGRELEPEIEPLMEKKSVSEIMSFPATGEKYTTTRTEDLLESLRANVDGEEYAYVEYPEQSLKETRIRDNEKVKKVLKAASAILVSLGLIVSGIAYGHILHERDKNMMEGLDQYYEFLDETGQRPSEDNYKYFVEHVYHNEDVPQETSGGRTNG